LVYDYRIGDPYEAFPKGGFRRDRRAYGLDFWPLKLAMDYGSGLNGFLLFPGLFLGEFPGKDGLFRCTRSK
jgi:hypothetical protein